MIQYIMSQNLSNEIFFVIAESVHLIIKGSVLGIWCKLNVINNSAVDNNSYSLSVLYSVLFFLKFSVW